MLGRSVVKLLSIIVLMPSIERSALANRLLKTAGLAHVRASNPVLTLLSSGAACSLERWPSGRRAAEQRDELPPSNVTCHAPLPQRACPVKQFTPLFDHSRQLRDGRNDRLAFQQPISRIVEGVPSALIRRRAAAQAQSATSVINRADAVQDIRLFRPQPFAGVPRSPYQ